MDQPYSMPNDYEDYNDYLYSLEQLRLAHDAASSDFDPQTYGELVDLERKELRSAAIINAVGRSTDALLRDLYAGPQDKEERRKGKHKQSKADREGDQDVGYSVAPKPIPPDQVNNKLFGKRYNPDFRKVRVSLSNDKRLTRRLETQSSPGAPISVYLGVPGADSIGVVRHPSMIPTYLQRNNLEYTPTGIEYLHVECAREQDIYIPVVRVSGKPGSNLVGRMVHGKPKDKPPKQHRIKSSLNGNNGSATNTDDHDHSARYSLMDIADECSVCWNERPLVRLHDACDHVFCVECCWALFDKPCPLCRAIPSLVETPSNAGVILNYRDNWYLEDYFRMYVLNRMYWITHVGRSDIDQLHLLRQAVFLSEMLVCVYRRYRWYRYCDRWISVPPPDILLDSIASTGVVVSPQINGNNGEWTNGDDMAQQANLHLPRRNALGVNGRLPPPEGGFQPRAADARGHNRRNAAARVHGLPPPPVEMGVPEPEREWRRRFHVQGPMEVGFVYDGNYYTEPLIDDGRFIDVLRPGTYDNVLRSGPGWMERGNGGKICYVGSPWATFTIPAYATFHRREPEFALRTLQGLMDATHSTLRLSGATQSTLQAVRNCVERTVRNFPADMLDALTGYLVKLTSYRLHVSTQQSQNIYCYTDPNPYALLEDDVYENDAMGSVEVLKPKRIYSENCDVQFEYEADPDIIVTGDVIMVPTGVVDANGVEGRRPEMIERPCPRRWYRTMMCSLEGARKFVEYECNDHNANKALKRLVAINDNHDARKYWEQYTSRRLHETFSAQWSGMRHSSVVATAAAVPLREPREPLWLDIHNDADALAIARAADLMNRYQHERFCRSYIDFVKEAVPEMSTWAYNQMYLAHMEYIEPLWSRWANANIPHVKKTLRQGYVLNHGTLDTRDIMVARLAAKVKRELAKPRKAPRLYVGYEAGCMYANELPEFVKVAMQTHFNVSRNGHMFSVYCFSKPRAKDIDEVFDRIARGLAPNTHILCIYSDDSVWAGNVGGELYAYNCDIAACDSSVKSMGFFLSGVAMAAFDVERAVGLIEQCKLPITLESRAPREHGPRHKIKISRRVDGLLTPIEGSGTVLTTINNFMVMLMSAFVYIERGDYGAPAAIRRAGVLCGLNLEVSDNFSGCPEKLQFLKFSPIMCSDDRYHMVRNLGPIFRSFGKVDGDLSAEQLGMTPYQFSLTNWTDRMNLFLSGVVQGYKHDPGYIVINALRARFTEPTCRSVESGMQMETAEVGYTANLGSIAARYDVTTSALSLLADEISKLQVGSIVVSDALTSIFEIDYSL